MVKVVYVNYLDLKIVCFIYTVHVIILVKRKLMER